jgi:hypothetical protein
VASGSLTIGDPDLFRFLFGAGPQEAELAKNEVDSSTIPTLGELAQNNSNDDGLSENGGFYTETLIHQGKSKGYKTRSKSPRIANKFDNVIHGSNNPYRIAKKAGRQYDNPSVIYTFTNGEVYRGNEISDWNRVAAGTRVSFEY